MTDRRQRLGEARLMLVVEARPPHAALEPLAAAALAGGADVVQLREKALPDADIVSAARRLRRLCDAQGALLLVNDRPDLALAGRADGVHVGQDDMAVDEARRVVGDELLVGLSTHSPDQIAAAEATSADYLGVGPVFATATKPAVTPVGLELVAHAAAHATRPFFAIGGIDPDTAAAVRAAGAGRLAVVRAIRDAADPRSAASRLRAALAEEAPVGAAG